MNVSSIDAAFYLHRVSFSITETNRLDYSLCFLTAGFETVSWILKRPCNPSTEIRSTLFHVTAAAFTIQCQLINSKFYTIDFPVTFECWLLTRRDDTPLKVFALSGLLIWLYVVHEAGRLLSKCCLKWTRLSDKCHNEGSHRKSFTFVVFHRATESHWSTTDTLTAGWSF